MRFAGQMGAGPCVWLVQDIARDPEGGNAGKRERWPPPNPTSAEGILDARAMTAGDTVEAPPSTPSLFSGKGTGSATIGMGSGAGWTDHHSGAWKKRLGDRRGGLAVKGAVRRCGMDGLIARASRVS